MTDIEKLLFQSDKAELLEWLQTNLPAAEKCFIAIAKKNGEGGLTMISCQFGCRWQYELNGFVDWVQRYVDGLEMEDDGEDCGDNEGGQERE